MYVYLNRFVVSFTVSEEGRWQKRLIPTFKKKLFFI